MSTNKIFYVYELWNPITSSIFYVGKGTKLLTKNKQNGYYRLSNHIKDTRYYKSGKYKRNHKYTTISKIIDAGMIPIIKVVFESYDEKDALNKEIDLIKYYGRQDIGTGILVNHTDGGEGMTGFKHSKEYIEKLKTDNKGGEVTSKQIYSISLNGLVTLYKSVNYAAKVLNGSKGNISNAATINKNRTAYGCYWRYMHDYNKDEDFNSLTAHKSLKLNGAKRVCQLDKGDIIRIWNSASEVCRYYNKSVSTLARHISSGKAWNGFIWKYTD